MEHSEDLNEEENLKNENEFLKMKLMLEQGAQFGNIQSDSELPAEIQNQFLKNIIEFEKQFEEHKTIKLFDKMERPTHFKSVSKIPEEEIDNAWNELNTYLRKYGIELSVCSPNIGKKELYRFATEELFKHEMDDMNLPGMMTGFIYDEFYPDHEYENKRTAVDDCIQPILEKEPFEWMHHFRHENLRLNENYPLLQEEFKNLVNLFKASFEDIILEEIDDPVCTISEKLCDVKGDYSLKAALPTEKIILKGKWSVEFELDEDLGYWYIINVQIEGINF